ncbi:NAD-dependent succinate-semialdehyde dehydrogenase [Phenylobacterium sp. Root77]|uniref:NAD-dependent succinate-semialdehyde dehydrogenase n=1 Tax=unclassified Phenylobacterium TaxID=2640670 RepID=UPI0007001BA0|nr:MULTISPECIES: NAD-dependent succinate-semialdehyde dehydrogenase [unclassified Phenylobacterium]KQW73463.1 NAD-dependent succinate-semialdehyde dehydrogenase [Phenylobacterium sp. Root1277]KQW92682.1 NAD-dependent succinate-semialdehyde dehydrogenase [Phenylobacterium sp. Root1290]KRC40910.1 NAD-dependent succinate-semialdehyde dehydrogenase [Phenylobacterium sp. Root77]
MSDQPSADQLKAGAGRLIRQAALVAGEWVPTDGANVIEVVNPADGTIIGRVPKLPKDQVERAIRAAADAFRPWAALKGAERGAILSKWAQKVSDNEDALAAIIALENGKPFKEALGEVRYANSFVSWFGNLAQSLDGKAIQSPNGQDLILAFQEPVGPVAAITPWNFPAAMITRKAAAAFCAGCPVVLKPASATPFTALALAALALEAGVPAGCFSVVTGAQEVVGGALTASPLIRKLSFTGSTQVGRTLAAQCAPTLKRLSMELGGAAPLLVFDDADIEVAVEGTVAGKFRAGGQTCVCPNRVYVQAGVRERFVAALVERVKTLKVGDPFAEGTVIGPLIDAKGVAKVEDHIARTVAAGGQVLTGGERLEGNFFQPTVTFGGDDELFCHEETFGPLVPVFEFQTEEEAVARANASEFGLAAFLFTDDLNRAMRVGRAIESGIVGINAGLISNAANPFGGVKQSGYGREGSVYGIADYMQVKALTLALR